METWELIKNQIEIQTKNYFNAKNIDIPNTVDLLREIIDASIDDDSNVGGLSSNLTNALYTILDDSSSRKERFANFQILKNVEPFLKKIIYFINHEQFLELQDNHKGLLPILNILHLNPSDIWLDKNHLERFTESDYEYHLIKTYLIRNNESHNAETLSNRELEANIESLLIFYLEVVNRVKNELEGKLIVVKNDFSKYIDSEIENFKVWAFRFVATDTIEDFSVFENYAIEYITDFDDEDDDSEDDENFVKERSGTVDSIRKNNLPEKRMLLWGDAGLGKSTTLQYLTYIDAVAYRDGTSNVIPVYVPLGMLIDKDESLMSYIFNKMEIEYADGIRLLKAGKMNLFLDGVNEIPEDVNSDIFSKRIKEVQSLIDNYHNSLIVISNRPEKYNQFKDIPVFRLQQMSYEKILDFLNKNTKNEEVKKIITERIKINQRLLNLISTPLMATRLISIVKEFKTVPENEGLIIKEFLFSLYKRERVEKHNTKFNDDKINHLLTSLAVYGFKKNKTNSGVSRIEVLKCFSNCLEEFHFDYDTDYALNTLIKIGVLNCNHDGSVIVFSHQAYQDFYVSCADSFTLLSDEELADIKNSINETSLTEDEKLNKFYEKNANEKQFEKSIIYKIHTETNEESRKKIEYLTNYNTKLAAKTFVSGTYDDSLKQLIIDKAKSIFEEINQKKADCIITFFILDAYEEIKYYIYRLLNIYYKKHKPKRYISNNLKKILQLISQELDINQILKLFLLINELVKEKYKKTIIRWYLNSIIRKRKRELNFVWSSDNLRDLKRIIKIIDKTASNKSYLLKYYITFNIPKEFLNKDLKTIAMELLVGPYSNQAESFLAKYYPEVEISGRAKFETLLKSEHGYSIRQSAKNLNSLLAKNETDDFIYIFNLDSRVRALVFTYLDKNVKKAIQKQYGYYYFFEYKQPPAMPDISRKRLQQILMEYKLYEQYKYPCKLFPKMELIKSKSNIVSENITDLNLTNKNKTAEKKEASVSGDISFSQLKEAIKSCRVESTGYVLVSLLKNQLEKVAGEKINIKMRTLINKYSDKLDIIERPAFSVKLKGSI